MPALLPSLIAFAFLGAGKAMFYYPNPEASLIEHILVDNWGAYASNNFSSAITPCTNYVTMVGEPSINSGRTTAAQWLRVAFHDFITSNVLSGTGGIDASIGFETARDENKGSAFDDSFTFWRPFVNEFVPMADLVALGAVMSVGLCGGKHIPFQPGRIDAVEADPTTGVPEPGTNLEETLSQFNRAGFNQVDSITLTACGHTMGSVHHGGFPEVSPASAVTTNNTNGGVNFDTTRGAFDSRVVSEYIDGTGQMGGPLVTSFNDTSRSDLRLYESDGNKTMQGLYDLGDGFQDVCVDVLRRMINTVPAAIVLQEVITPQQVKPVNVTWDFDLAGRLALTSKIRVFTNASAEVSPISLGVAGKTIIVSAEQERGTTVMNSRGAGERIEYGSTSYYSFTIPGRNLRNATSFTVSTGLVGIVKYPIEWGAFIVPSISGSDGQHVNFAVAIPQGVTDALPADMEVKVVAPVPQPLTLAPQLVGGSGRWVSRLDSRDGFTLWSGMFDLGQNATGAISLRLWQGRKVVDTLLLNAGVAGW